MPCGMPRRLVRQPQCCPRWPPEVGTVGERSRNFRAWDARRRRNVARRRQTVCRCSSGSPRSCTRTRARASARRATSVAGRRGAPAADETTADPRKRLSMRSRAPSRQQRCCRRAPPTAEPRLRRDEAFIHRRELACMLGRRCSRWTAPRCTADERCCRSGGRWQASVTRRGSSRERAIENRARTAARETAARETGRASESVKNIVESKNDGGLDFFFRIPETGVLSNLRAGRAPTHGLSRWAVSG